MKYNHLSGKLYEVTVDDQTVIVEYSGNNHDNDLKAIAYERILNNEHTNHRMERIKKRMFSNGDNGNDEETL